METQKEGVKGKGIVRKQGKYDGDFNEYVIRRETGIGGSWQDRVTGGCWGLRDFFGFLKMMHVFDVVCKHLSVKL